MAGAAEDLLLYFNITSRLANETGFPQWYDGNEFKAIRDASAGER
jgi:hypothetical protein